MAENRFDDKNITPPRRGSRPFAGPAAAPRAPLLKPPVAPMRPTRPPFTAVRSDRSNLAAPRAVAAAPHPADELPIPGEELATSAAVVSGEPLDIAEPELATPSATYDAPTPDSWGNASIEVPRSGEPTAELSPSADDVYRSAEDLAPASSDAAIESPRLPDPGAFAAVNETAGDDVSMMGGRDATSADAFFDDPWSLHVAPADHVAAAESIPGVVSDLPDTAAALESSSEPAWLRDDAPVETVSSVTPATTDEQWPAMLLAEYAPYVPVPTLEEPGVEPSALEASAVEAPVLEAPVLDAPVLDAQRTDETVSNGASNATTAGADDARTSLSAAATPSASEQERAAIAIETTAMEKVDALETVVPVAIAAVGPSASREAAAATLERLAERVRAGEIDVSSVAPDSTEAAVLASILAALLGGSARR